MRSWEAGEKEGNWEKKGRLEAGKKREDWKTDDGRQTTDETTFKQKLLRMFPGSTIGKIGKRVKLKRGKPGREKLLNISEFLKMLDNRGLPPHHSFSSNQE